MDNVDNCIETSNPDQADGNNDGVGDICDTSYKNVDNISIETTSETCQGENDGKITVNVEQTFVSYTVTLKGDGVDLSEQLTTASMMFENLAPGSYEVCVKVNDRDDYTQCFEINIDASNPVSLRVAKNQATKDYTVNVTSGTAPYNVYLNGDLLNTFNKEECKFIGSVVDEHIFISVSKKEEHFWSPQLHLEIIEKSEKTSLLKGLFGPKPQVWTFFMFLHFVVATAFLIFGVMAYSNWSLDKNSILPIVMLVVLPIVWVILYFVGSLGKSTGQKQMDELKSFTKTLLKKNSLVFITETF